MDYLEKNGVNMGYSSMSSMTEKMVSDMSIQAIKIAMKSQADLADWVAEYKAIKKELNNALHQIGEKETLLAEKITMIAQLETEAKEKEDKWEKEKSSQLDQWYDQYSKAKGFELQVKDLKEKLAGYEKQEVEG